MSCAHFGRDQICTQVDASFSPFGHPIKANASRVTSINGLLANEIQDMSALKWFFCDSRVLACEQAPSKGGKKFGERASGSQSIVTPRAKRTPSSPDCSRLIPFVLDCTRLSPTGACSQATRVLVRKLASAFGHPTQVSTQVQLAPTCDYLPVRLTRALNASVKSGNSFHAFHADVLLTLAKETRGRVSSSD